MPPGQTGVGRAGGRGATIASGLIVRDGILFYTVGVNAYAIDGRNGRQLWHYVARSSGGLSNRGLAIAGDTIFMMANDGLTALDVATGTERWVKELGGPVPANAPLRRPRSRLRHGRQRRRRRAIVDRVAQCPHRRARMDLVHHPKGR